MDSPTKIALIMKVIRAEITYLGEAGWLLYCGVGAGDNADMSYYDEASGTWKMWGPPGSPTTANKGSDLYTQGQAMSIQRAKDKF